MRKNSARKLMTTVIAAAAAAGCLTTVSFSSPAVAASSTQVASGSVSASGSTLLLNGTNVSRLQNYIVAYTPARGTTTKTTAWGHEVAVVNGKVVKTEDRIGNMTVPSGGYVLSGNGTSRDWLRANATLGKAITVSGVALSTPAPKVRIGMAPGPSSWDARLAETGKVYARRIFDDLGSPDFGVSTATTEAAAGRLPVLSFKIPGDDWAGVAAGKYDTQLRNLTAQLAAIKGQVFVTLHHEPSGDGTPANYAAMMRHALPILGAPTNVDAGPIVNGYWWSSKAQGYTDAEIAQWLPSSVLSVSEVVAADTYQGGTVTALGEDAATKMRNMGTWATRVGVKRLGIGEYNGLTAGSIKAAGDTVLADPRFAFANIYNSNFNNRDGVSWLLTGDRLAAFKATVAGSVAP